MIQKSLKMVQIGLNQLRMAQWLQKFSDGSKSFLWLKIAQNDSKCFKKFQPGLIWLKMVQMGSKWLKLPQIGSKWFKMIQNDSKKFQIGSNGSNWLKSVLNS